jgi:hypothetical protein
MFRSVRDGWPHRAPNVSTADRNLGTGGPPFKNFVIVGPRLLLQPSILDQYRVVFVPATSRGCSFGGAPTSSPGYRAAWPLSPPAVTPRL